MGMTPCFSSVQVGDGTTSVTLLAAEFLKQVKPYVEEGLHPQIIIRAFRTATQLVRQRCSELRGVLGSTTASGERTSVPERKNNTLLGKIQ